MTDATEFLEALFAVTERTPKAEIDALTFREARLNLGFKPWFPAAVEAWLNPLPTPTWRGAPADWLACRELVMQLHADYTAAKARRGG